MSIAERYQKDGIRAFLKNKMGTMPIRKLLISMSLPMMASMLVTGALQHRGQHLCRARQRGRAHSRLHLLPIQNLMIAFGVGIGVGVNALLSRASAGDQPRAQRIALQGYFSLRSSAAPSLFWSVFSPWISSSAARLPTRRSSRSARTISPSAVFSPWASLPAHFERLLQATGRTVLSMISQCGARIINIIILTPS